MGMAFAAGWAPCIGPILATILATAAVGGTVVWGGVLLALYSFGLGIPFVLLALGFTRAQTSMAWLRRNGRRIEIGGGVLLIAVGVLFVTGEWQPLFLSPAAFVRGSLDGHRSDRRRTGRPPDGEVDCSSAWRWRPSGWSPFWPRVLQRPPVPQIPR